MIKIGLNGFGRIGRAITRIIEQSSDFEIVVINEIDPDIKNSAYLLKYDSTYGRFCGTVDARDDKLVINGRDVQMHFERSGAKVDKNADLLLIKSGWGQKRGSDLYWKEDRVLCS